jgi:hypothetical protein
MVSLDQKSTAQKIRTPVAHSMDKADQLRFIGCKFGMADGDRPAEVGDRASALVKDGVQSDP